MTYDGIGYIGDNVDPSQYLYFQGSGAPYLLSSTLVGQFIAANTPPGSRPGAGTNSPIPSLYQQFTASIGSMPTSVDDLLQQMVIYGYMRSGETIPGLVPVSFGVGGEITNYSANEQIVKDYISANNPAALQVQNSALFQDILTNFKATIGINTENWNVFVNNNQVVLQPGATLDSYAAGLLNAAFGKFASSTTIAPNDGQSSHIGRPLLDALSNLKIANYVTVDLNSSPFKASYQQFYTAFFGSTAGFDDFFAKFVKDTYGDPAAGVTGTSGSFTPSTSFDEWTTAVMTAYYSNSSITSNYSKSSAYGDGEKTFTLNRIINLLIGMTESLQKVAAAQSNRLGVYAAWQNAYTDLQNEIKYAASDDARFNSNFTGNTDKRGDYNSANSSFTEIIKARKSTVGDDAKNFQTQVSQSSDAVNQQTNMATSIMQEMSTLLAAIYR